jgi:glutamate N-acetyltransferase/amino-acid N-acetyltransferase
MNGLVFERILGGVCAPTGFLAAGVACGVKGDGKLDLALVCSEKPASVAGVFTTNEMEAAPVKLSRERVTGGSARAVVVSSGNANAMTGEQGEKDARVMAASVEKTLGLSEGEALVASTGPIGKYLPMENVTAGIDQAVAELSVGGNTDAAKAIMTTDTYPKELAVEMEIGGKTVRVGAMVKGSGMICPDMATMICVITTDIWLESELMQVMLERAVEWSFNRISVDGDQSTNDTVLMLANGAALGTDYELEQEEKDAFFASLCWLTGNLSMALVKDGEGASKMLRVVVNGARSDAEAVLVAKAVATSNLVKCAFYGSLPNWGRVAAAAGTAGVGMDQSKLDITFGTFKVAEGGKPSEADEAELIHLLDRDEVEITLYLGEGEGSAYYVTCDLTPEYVEFNATEKS